MRGIQEKVMRGKSNVIKRNIEKVCGAHYTFGARYKFGACYLAKNTVIQYMDVYA
jgi:hypothetical protein